MMHRQPLQAEVRTLTLAGEFRIAHGVSTERQVLRLKWDGAIGEAPFVPYYGEDPEQTLQWLQRLEWQGSPTPERGPKAGRLALDLLWHDHLGRQRGEPLWKLWQLSDAPLPPACRSFSIPTDLAAFTQRVQAVAAQFPVLKLKLGSGDIAFDEEIVAKAREAAPQSTLLVDVNGGWSVEETLVMLSKMERHGVALVEQPVHHREGLGAWKELARHRTSSVPLFADESAQQAADVHQLAGLVDGVNIKLLKCGSLREARAMIRAARELGMKTLLGCMIESSIGITAASHLAPLVDWVDLDGHLYLAHDDYTGLHYASDGTYTLPDAPGLGVHPIGV